MTTAQKLTMLKSLLKIANTEQDAELLVYLNFAKMEILSWLYSGNTPADISDTPERYIPVQVMACVAGYGISGAENQTSHNENGIQRSFQYSDMVQYIRSHVIPFAVVI